MIVGVPKETYPGERRVALTPAAAASLMKAGHEVHMERGAGEAAGFPDAPFEEKGVLLAPSREAVFEQAQAVLQVRGYGANPEAGKPDLALVREGQALLGFHEPLSASTPVRELAGRGVFLFALELVPRITRAQSMDALSSMAMISGYKAVLIAAERLPRMFPLMMTAAGTLSPARVFVIGAGVAGLQAIATARRIGAVVTAYDLRPAVKEQVESLGARFAELPIEAGNAEGKGGYARAMDEAFYRRQREFMQAIVAENDVVITTAAVPGKKAPMLISRDMIAAMKPGSAIVDLAAERGGNCEPTKPDEAVEVQGVTVLGPTNLAATVPYHASQMIARNLANLLIHLAGSGSVESGRLLPAADDEITRETLVTRDGEVIHPAVREALGLGAPE